LVSFIGGDGPGDIFPAGLFVEGLLKALFVFWDVVIVVSFLLFAPIAGRERCEIIAGCDLAELPAITLTIVNAQNLLCGNLKIFATSQVYKRDGRRGSASCCLAVRVEQTAGRSLRSSNKSKVSTIGASSKRTDLIAWQWQKRIRWSCGYRYP
jgi:hypothetical protein